MTLLAPDEILELIHEHLLDDNPSGKQVFAFAQAVQEKWKEKFLVSPVGCVNRLVIEAALVRPEDMAAWLWPVSMYDEENDIFVYVVKP
jgi:hypothetical protein